MRKILSVFLLGTMFSMASNSLFAKQVLETAKINGESYTSYIEQEKGIKKYYISCEGSHEEELWKSSEDQKLAALVACKNIINKAEEFANQTVKKYDSEKWTRIFLNRPKDDDDDWSSTSVECFAKKDAVIHITCKSDDHSKERSANYIFITDPEMVNNFVGEKVYGLDKETFIKKFGEGVGFATLQNLTFSFTLLSADNRIGVDFLFKDNKVVGIKSTLDRYFNGIAYFEDFKNFVSPNIPEGLFTKGICLGDNVNIRETPVNGAQKHQINMNDTLFISEFKKVDNKETWVKVVTPSGKEGWVSGNYVAPSVHCFNAFARMGATFDYISNLGLRLGEPKSSSEERYMGTYVLNTQKWDGVELKMTYDSGTFGDEEDEMDPEVDVDEEEPEEIEEAEDEDTLDDNIYENRVKEPERILVKMTITKPIADFVGFKVDSNVEELKALAKKLAMANWIRQDKNAIKGDGTFTWHDTDDNNYTKGIIIKMSKGKAVSLELVGPNLAD